MVRDMGVGLWLIGLCIIVVVLFVWLTAVLVAGGERYGHPNRPQNHLPERGGGASGGVLLGDRGTTNVYGH